MKRPPRLRLSRAKGFRLPAGAVNVARPSAWGNPFVVGRDGTRQACVQKYVALLRGYVCVSGKASLEAQEKAYAHVRTHLHELRGRPLACWCPLPEPGATDLCHAAVLLEAANLGRVDPRGLEESP